MTDVVRNEPDEQKNPSSSSAALHGVGDGANGEQQEEEWETRAGDWLSTLPMRRNVSTEEMDGWINSNLSSLPDHLKSQSRSHLYGRLISLHKLIRRSVFQASDAAPVEPYNRPFKRTDQWIPVYTWLESLDGTEIVKAKTINEWLSQHPTVKEQLSASHSRYQLMHYIRKCHANILKKKEKLRKRMAVQHAAKENPSMNLNTGVTTVADPLSTLIAAVPLSTLTMVAAPPSTVTTVPVPLSTMTTVPVPLSTETTVPVPLSAVSTAPVSLSTETVPVPLSPVSTVPISLSETTTAPVPLSTVSTGPVPLSMVTALPVPLNMVATTTVPISTTATVAVLPNTGNLPKDINMPLSKKDEAFLRYELLTDLQNQLSSILSRHGEVDVQKESSPSLHRQRSAT